MASVFCLGEALIDFICTDIDKGLQNGNHFLKKAGGAPANAAAAVVRLGGEAAMCGKVGEDAFGRFLIEEMEKHGINCRHVLLDKDHATTLAFVSVSSDGERDFEFVRGADGHLAYDDLPADLFSSYGILHFGSATALLDGVLKETYETLLKHARDQGALVSFDPNFRGLLWKGQEDIFVERIKACLPYVDLLKMSDDEARLIFGKEELLQCAGIAHKYGIKTVAITMGSRGAVFSSAGIQDEVRSFPVEAVDSTGAGDAFVGALLYRLSLEDKPIDLLESPDKVRMAVEYANAAGALTCTGFGAMGSMPTSDAVHYFIRRFAKQERK